MTSKIRQPSPVVPHYAARSFGDMDELGQTIGWDLDFRQLEPGRLKADVAIVAGPRVSAMMIELDRGFHQQGAPPRGRHTFGILEPDAHSINWCGGTGEADEVLIFNQPGGFDAVSRAGHRGNGEEVVCCPGPHGATTEEAEHEAVAGTAGVARAPDCGSGRRGRRPQNWGFPLPGDTNVRRPRRPR